MFKTFIFLLIFTFSLSSHASTLETAGQEITSPFTTPARDYLLVGSVLTGVLVIDSVEDTLGHRVQDDTVEDKPLGRFSIYGDLAGQMIPNALYSLGFYSAYLFADDMTYKKNAILMLKATAYTGLATSLLKVSVREPRPNGPNRHSFPSGHTASAFAFASYIGVQHKWYWGVLAYSMAGVVALSRINDNAHRIHDVVGGATIGLSYGLGLSYLYKKTQQKNYAVFLSPQREGVSVNLNLVF